MQICLISRKIYVLHRTSEGFSDKLNDFGVFWDILGYIEDLNGYQCDMFQLSIQTYIYMPNF